VWRPREPYAIFQGYWNQPQATVDIWRNLWFHSGDAGLVDKDGYFTFRDRIKDSIRRRGENISSFEVELAVRGQSGVVECAAFAVPSGDATTDEDVMIAVVPSPDSRPDPETLFRALCAEMPRHAVPRYLRFVDELPKTPTQRVQKFRLRADGVTSDTVDRQALGIFPPRE
jgi:crotonobetaine/carnitine-CoA ligase